MACRCMLSPKSTSLHGLYTAMRMSFLTPNIQQDTASSMYRATRVMLMHFEQTARLHMTKSPWFRSNPRVASATNGLAIENN